LAYALARADLLLALSRAGVTPQSEPGSDPDMRAEIKRRIDAEDWSRTLLVNVVVHDGKASLWGVIDSTEERKTVRRLVEEVPGVVEVEDCSRGHLYYR
jgi:osmotically-inducible protein OsmY